MVAGQWLPDGGYRAWLTERRLPGVDDRAGATGRDRGGGEPRVEDDGRSRNGLSSSRSWNSSNGEVKTERAVAEEKWWPGSGYRAWMTEPALPSVTVVEGNRGWKMTVGVGRE
ncbi:hypothetical protein Dimus_026410 [Dionaea muscipula]